MEPLLGLAQGEFFLVVLFVALPIAAIAFASAGKVYDEIGKGAFAMDHQDHEGGGEYGGIGSSAAAQAEIRQMVEAKSYRRVARGLEPLDVDAEIARLMTPTSPPINDPELVEEVRQMVEAKNARRDRKSTRLNSSHRL